ncbi:hypothetical protein FB45DRAFT_1017396 [Roridomyces roridus]|uniref:Uncharacterized protein n=1 Tax=Roridomyces roridus TaxID=1738132 RepID=A0AAD7CII5_9AGAR|nr:hypothetical protein FB45DRAFT_1017396 [Roridomyces roridus]
MLYLTQELALGFAIRKYSSLTETHDRMLAWSGIGSSLSTLYQQVSSSGLGFSVLAITGYFLALSLLHVTTPALFSVQPFDQIATIPITLQSIPQWNDSDQNAAISYTQNSAEFLSMIRTLDTAHTIGLRNSSLYDTPIESYPNSQPLGISATGFQVTCRSIAGVVDTSSIMEFPGLPSILNVKLSALNTTVLAYVPGPSYIAMSNPFPYNGSIMLYITNKVIDSHGNTSSPVLLGDTSPVPQIQFMECTRFLISQSAQVDPAARTLIESSLEPAVDRTSSQWPTVLGNGSNDATFIGGTSWVSILANLRVSGIVPPGWDSQFQMSWGDVFLAEELGLDTSWGYNAGQSSASSNSVYLHDVENALGKLLASIFWTGGNAKPLTLTMEYGFQNGTPTSVVQNIQKPPVLLTKNETLSQIVPAARLEMSPFAVSIGLGASLVALILGIYFATGPLGPKSHLNSLGLLQIIWVTHHHPDLKDIFDEANDETDALREAGMVKVRLVDAE